jgi:hypothetical protein
LAALAAYERATGERGSLPAMHDEVQIAAAPVLGSQAADNAAWQEVHDALYYASQADGVASGPASHTEADELTAVVMPILARLVDAARVDERAKVLRHMADGAKGLGMDAYDYLDGAARAAEQEAGR